MLRICLIFTIIFLNLSNFSFAKDESFYTINDIYVFETADSSSFARTKSISSARRKGLSKIFEKLNLKPALLEKVTDDQISQTVKSEQVKQEVIDKNSYSATFNIEYDKSAIDYFLNKDKAKSANNYLLIPIKEIADNSYVLWEKQNDWKTKISQNVDRQKDNSSSEINFVIPDSDIENISAINGYNIKSMSYKDFVSTLTKYNASGVYTVFYSNDKEENKINIDIFFIGNLQKKHVKLNFLNAHNLAYENLLNIVSKKTVEYLLSNKSAKLREETSNLSEITFVDVDFEKILEIKKLIENSGLVGKVAIKSVSRDATVIVVNYDNDDVSIEGAFSTIGLNLTKTGNNHYLSSSL